MQYRIHLRPQRGIQTLRRERLLANDFEEQSGKIFGRERLLAGNSFDGPAIVVERTATTIVEPGFRADIQSTGEIILVQEA